MCGIVGYVGHREAWPVVLAGLQHLEYRGYDSAGIAVLTPSRQLFVHKSAGKVKELASSHDDRFPGGHLGLGHTRWATHGKPTDANAHPHTDCHHQVAVVHNGIVENYLELKRDLVAKGHRFASETDSESIAHLIEEGLAAGLSFEDAFVGMSTKLQGSQAIVAAYSSEPAKKLLALRLGNAGGIVVAHRPGEAMVSSDLSAIVPFADSVSFLEDGEIAIVTDEAVKFTTPGGKIVEKEAQPVSQTASWADKEGYRHFMLKEIMEQPRAVASALRGRVDFEKAEVVLEDFPLSHSEVEALQKVVLIGCGTSLHAAMVGRHCMEELAGLATEVDSGSRVSVQEFPRG